MFIDISIIIPIFNEEENIENLIIEIINNLNLEKKINFEIIVVNDFSTDRSLIILEEISKKIKINIVNNGDNVGQSYSILNGVKSSKFETIVTLDGDGQNDPKDILKLLEIYLSSNDIKLVGGLRTNRKDNVMKIFSSKIANYFRNLILKDDCTDTGCGIKVFDKKIFLSFFHFNGIHRFLPALFKHSGNKTKFVSVNHRPRTKGLSKYGILNRLFVGIIDIAKVYKIIKKFKS